MTRVRTREPVRTRTRTLPTVDTKALEVLRLRIRDLDGTITELMDDAQTLRIGELGHQTLTAIRTSMIQAEVHLGIAVEHTRTAERSVSR